MASPILIPFKAYHLLGFIHRDGEFEESIKDAVVKEMEGPAWTAIYNEEIIGCAGMLISGTGMGRLWACFAPEMANHRFWIHRICRRMLKDIIRAFGLRRVELVALADNYRNLKWAMTLGFTRETGIAHSYTMKGQDVVRFEWFK